MTFIVAFATRDWAVMAADLGLWRYDADTETGALLPERSPKIAAVNGGWLGLGGNRHIGNLVAEHLATGDPVSGLPAAGRAVEAALAQFRPAYADYARAARELLLVSGDASGCSVQVLDWQAGTALPYAGATAIPPLGLDAERMAPLLATYERAMLRADGLVGLLRATADLFLSVASACPETCADEFELALVLRRPEESVVSWKLQPMSAHAVCNASHEQIAEWARQKQSTHPSLATIPERDTHIAGGGVVSSQGKIKFVELFGPKVVRAIFPSQEIRIETAGPGYEERLPEFFVLSGWDEQKGTFAHSSYAAHAGALLNLGNARLGPPRELDHEVCKWLVAPDKFQEVDETYITNVIATRTVKAMGPGLLDWRFTTIYPYPELEVGDLVLVQTDKFVARDPSVARALRGMLWVVGVIVRCDVSARRFGVWIRNYADIGVGLEQGTQLGLGDVPEITELVPNVTQTGVVTAVVKSQKGQSVKLATSTSAEPSAATVRAATVQALDADGILRTGTLATLTAGQTLYIAAFAYSNANGAGAESKLAAAKITHYEGGVSADGFESARTAYTLTFTITARDADLEQVKLHYRSVTAVSDSYTSPTPTSTSLNAPPYTPAAVVIDRGLTDRIFEWWAEDASGNQSAIQRLAILASTSSDQENAITGFAASGAFVGSCPSQNVVDTITWTEGSGVPTSWVAKLYVCEQGTSGCTPPTTGPFNSDAATGATRNSAAGPGIQSGFGSTTYRKYRIRLKNSYGELMDDDVSTELADTYDPC